MGRAGGAPLATPIAVVSFAPLARAARLFARGMMVVGAGKVTSMGTVRSCVSVCGGSIVRRELSLRGSGDRRRAQGASHGNFAPKNHTPGLCRTRGGARARAYPSWQGRREGPCW